MILDSLLKSDGALVLMVLDSWTWSLEEDLVCSWILRGG